MRARDILLIAVLTGCAQEGPLPAGGAPDYIQLEDHGLVVELTPSFGGRVTAFGLAGLPSVVKFDSKLAAERPKPSLAPADAATPWYGHTVWAGPQSEWWAHQDAYPDLAGQIWPPDPYQSSQTMTAEHADGDVSFTGEASPVTGLKIRQDYAFTPAGCLKVSAVAENARAANIAWDIWFNTRVRPDVWVLAPQADGIAVRQGAPQGPDHLLPMTAAADGVAIADPSLEGVTAPRRQGKLFLTPDEGWMAAAMEGQVFLVFFDLLQLEEIHPEQGQVELYFSQIVGDADASVIEMETHAAYRTLAPGETMRADQYWTALPYDGALEQDAITGFVRERTVGGNFCKESDGT